MNARETNQAIQAEFEKARLGKSRPETINRNIRALVGRSNRPVSPDSIPAVNAPGPRPTPAVTTGGTGTKARHAASSPRSQRCGP